MKVRMASMLTFTSIGDEMLRQVLESDYRELQSCIAGQSWKAAVVLSGSIVEAVLTDYLLSEPTVSPDPLTMQLSDLIDTSLRFGGIDQHTADLSAVIRSYRNLIHPGRVTRLGDSVDEESANIAVHVVSIVVRQIAAKRIQVHGYTAVQLVDKLVSDPSAMAIAKHLIADLPKQELVSLLLREIPERHISIDQEIFGDEEDSSPLIRLTDLFYLAYAAADVATRKLAAKQFVSILKEDSGWRVKVFEDNFFNVDYLEHLDDSDKQLLKDYLFADLDNKLTPSRLEHLKGISKFISEGEVIKLFDPFFKALGYSRDDSWSNSSGDWVLNEFSTSLSTELQPALLSRTDDWIKYTKQKEQLTPLDHFSELKEKMETRWFEPF